MQSLVMPLCAAELAFESGPLAARVGLLQLAFRFPAKDQRMHAHKVLRVNARDPPQARYRIEFTGLRFLRCALQVI